MFKKLIGAALLIAFTVNVHAQSRDLRGLHKDRAGRMETTIGANKALAWSVKDQSGASLDVKDDTGWAFGLGYNFDNHWNLSFALDVNDAKYDATFIDDNGDQRGISHKLSSYNSQFNGTYNFFEGAFTPFVQAGLGWSYINTNVRKDDPVTGCWIDYWGRVWCNTYYKSYSQNEFSYNVGAGLRYEFNRDLFVKASYNSVWTEIGPNEERLDNVKLELGFML